MSLFRSKDSLAKVMAIINTTPDSFYAKSRVSEKELLKACEEHLMNGASILDIGGYSTRPGALEVSLEEEKKRTVDAVRVIGNHFPQAVISIDTFRYEVAFECVNAGANIVNDITGGADEKMLPWIKKQRIPYILMHMRGTPQNMTELCDYEDVVLDVVSELSSKVKELKNAGVDLMIDPGFGFAKTLDQNYTLLNDLKEFDKLGCPLLVGVSRKSMIYNFLNIDSSDALNGTTILNTVSLLNGASVLRVHDTKEAMECVKLVNKLKKGF